MTYKTYNDCDRIEEADTMLELLRKCRILKAEIVEGKFMITECCEDYFYVNLTKEQALVLADEIRQLANNL